jgi:hypothetical protein
VLRVGSDLAGIGIPMRCVLALAAMRFLPQADDPRSDEPRSDEPQADENVELVRVRLSPTWLRIDARFGSVFRRRGDPALVLG